MEGPTCVKCKKEMRPERNGMKVVQTYLDPPRPYKAYAGDKYKCPDCGIEVIPTNREPSWIVGDERPAPNENDDYVIYI